MGFERDRLPDPRSYFESEGLKLAKARAALDAFQQLNQAEAST